MFGINKKFKNAKKDSKATSKGKNGKESAVKKPSPVPDLICKVNPKLLNQIKQQIFINVSTRKRASQTDVW